MIIWRVLDEESEREIEVGPITILKGSDVQWYKLIRNIEDYFCNKNSLVKIYEDTQEIFKKDWECSFIPFDAHLQLDKLTSKSPLRPIIDQISEEIFLSPIFHELIDIWEELKDEIEIISKKVGKYNVQLELTNIEREDFKSYLSFKTLTKLMTPIAYKKLLLTLYGEKPIEKKRLILIELPELYAEKSDFLEIIQIVQYFSKKGIRFIIVTQKEIDGHVNQIFDEKVINNAVLENIKRIVLNQAPFVCEDSLFEKAKSTTMKAVDNFRLDCKYISLSTGFKEDEIIVLFIINKLLRLNINIDTTGMSTNLSKFVNTYSC